MIEQILNREFVRQQMETLREELREQVSRFQRQEERPPEHLDVPDFREATAALDAAARREARRSSGPAGYEPPSSGRRKQPAPPLDDRSFFSRDPIINIIQSALEEYFEERGEVEEVAPLTRGRRGRRARDELPVVTGRALSGTPLPRRTTRGSGARRILEQFSITDPRWVNSKIAEGIRLFRGKAPFNNRPATPVTIANRVRLVLVGDWGSGVPRARSLAEKMRGVLDDGRRNRLEQHVIHLGDVYYSGWKREYEARFLDCWPVRADEAHEIGSWSVNGNHDMYSGGHAYFDVLLGDPRFARQERSSFFSLQNDDWNILGLDTAWEDADLVAPQPAWVAAKVKDSKRRLLLLSHHQLFSAFEKCGKKLSISLRQQLASGRIRAWFWGHEHRCAIYNAHQGVANPRCVGHGGVPVYQWHSKDSPYPKLTRYEFRDYVTSGLLERWALFGFAVADLDGPHAHVRYVDENGNEHYTEDIE